MTKPYLMYIDPENESAGLKIEWRTHKGPGTIAQLSSELADQHPADLDITTTTDEFGFEQTLVTVNEERKAQRIAAETSKREAQEQKESLRSQRKQAEVQKLRSAGLTLEQKVEILWKLAAVDKGVVDLAEDEPGEGKDPGEKMERP